MKPLNQHKSPAAAIILAKTGLLAGALLALIPGSSWPIRWERMGPHPT
jgi:hypothetical protein